MNWTDLLSDRSRSAVIAGLTAAIMLLGAGVTLALYDSKFTKLRSSGK